MIERYVRRELSDAERQVFEEHILDCADCFEQVQEMERFAAGMRHHFANSPADPRGARWFWPSLAAGLAAGAWTAGALWGAMDPDALRAAGPTYLVEEPEGLLSLA